MLSGSFLMLVLFSAGEAPCAAAADEVEARARAEERALAALELSMASSAPRLRAGRLRGEERGKLVSVSEVRCGRGWARAPEWWAGGGGMRVRSRRGGCDIRTSPAAKTVCSGAARRGR